MRGGKSLLFRALAAREPEHSPAIRSGATPASELPGINEQHCTIARIAPLSSYFSAQRFARVWVQRDINGTRAVAHMSNERRFKRSVATYQRARADPRVKGGERVRERAHRYGAERVLEITARTDD